MASSDLLAARDRDRDPRRDADGALVHARLARLAWTSSRASTWTFG